MPIAWSQLWQPKLSPGMVKFTFGDKIGLGWEPLLYVYSNLPHSHLFSLCQVESPVSWQKKFLGWRHRPSSIRKIGNHQQKVSSLYSRKNSRPSISWLNCLSTIAWFASFSTRAFLKHFSQKLTLPTFRVKWKSSNLILSGHCLDSKVAN